MGKIKRVLRVESNGPQMQPGQLRAALAPPGQGLGDAAGGTRGNVGPGRGAWLSPCTAHHGPCQSVVRQGHGSQGPGALTMKP